MYLHDAAEKTVSLSMGYLIDHPWGAYSTNGMTICFVIVPPSSL
jgi:hypothetical protein